MNKSSVWAFFGHPFVGILGSVASVASVGLAVYFYYASLVAPNVCYYVHPARSPVVSAGEASRLSVNYNGMPVSGDISAAQIALWNSGKAALRASDILTPVAIHTGSNTRILEASVRKSSRQVAAIKLNTAEAARGDIAVGWNILEQNDGCVIQIIYAGSSDLPITVSGAVVGQRTLTELHYNFPIQSATDQYTSRVHGSTKVGWLLMVVTVVMAICFMTLAVLERWFTSSRGMKVSLTRRIYSWFMCGLALAFPALALWLLLAARSPEPPFGF